MKKNILNRNVMGESIPTVVNGNHIFEVHKCDDKYIIMENDRNAVRLSRAMETEAETMLFLWNETPAFDSKIKAVKYMMENANRFV